MVGTRGALILASILLASGCASSTDPSTEHAQTLRSVAGMPVADTLGPPPPTLGFGDPDSTETTSGSISPATGEQDMGLPDYADLDLPAISYVATATGSAITSVANPLTGQSPIGFANPTQFGGPRVFLVTDDDPTGDRLVGQPESDNYVRVSLPLKPNGQQGWIPRSQVTITPVEHRAVVDLANHAVTVWEGDDVVLQTRAVTGTPSTPTPLGLFYVRDIIEKADTSGPYGPRIVALSGFSEAMDSFGGGLPAIAIHGTNRPELIGQERSNGCVRIPNDLITELAEIVPLGTPVTIVA